MLARIVLSLAILMHAFPAWICVAACRVRADSPAIESCIMVCAPRPLVIGAGCSGECEPSPCAGCCAASCDEPESVSDEQFPCGASGCPDCALCICTLGPYHSYPPTQPPTQAPAPDPTPVALTWIPASFHAPVETRCPVFDAPARPPWQPTRSMLSVWTI